MPIDGTLTVLPLTPHQGFCQRVLFSNIRDNSPAIVKAAFTYFCNESRKKAIQEVRAMVEELTDDYTLGLTGDQVSELQTNLDAMLEKEE